MAYQAKQGASMNAKIGITQGLKSLWPSVAYTREDLAIYKTYPVLYGERKFARVFPKQVQTLSFTEDLPAEIRLRIYEYLPIQSPGAFFELWDIKSWNSPMCREDPEYSRSFEIGEATTTQNNHRSYRLWRKILGIMRVCKGVNVEVAELFYSKQNFRFTNANGFTTMTHWMYTIRSENCSRLRHITVHLPVVDLDANRRRCVQSINKWTTLERIHTTRGLQAPDYRYKSRHFKKGINSGEWKYDKSVRKGFRYLAKIPELQKLEIIVPWDYEWLKLPVSRDLDKWRELKAKDRIRILVETESIPADYWWYLSELQQDAISQALKISLVIHHGMRDVSQDLTPFVQMCMCRARWLAAYAKDMEYGFGHTHWQNGSYAIRYDEDALLRLPSPEDLYRGSDGILEPHEIF